MLRIQFPFNFNALLPCLVFPCLRDSIIFLIAEIKHRNLYFNGFEFGFLIIALNGFLTFLGLLAISYHDSVEQLDNPWRKHDNIPL